MATKHEQILTYIESLPVGEKISVRRIAKDMQVSEGTAYRAIKEAESQRIVSTIERVGTIRIEKKKKDSIEKLTFAEVVNIVDGQVLGGKNGLHKSLTKFVIGAMQLDDMMRYIEPGNLLIVGNRSKAQSTALHAGAAVLITGGFDTSEDVKAKAEELELPVISTTYDTFTVATMINRAIDDQLIKKEILYIEDIYIPLKSTNYLTISDSLKVYHELNAETNHAGFPVIDSENRVVGVVTARDVIGVKRTELIEKIMTKNPITVSMKTSVAQAAHQMIWEGIDLMPVVNEQNILQGVISRQDVLKALQLAQMQPQRGETIDDAVKNQIQLVSSDDTAIEFLVTPQMTNQFGSISHGALSTLVTEAGRLALKQKKRGESVLEQLNIVYIKPIQVDRTLWIKPTVLDMSRRFAKLECDVFAQGTLVAKAMMMYQVFDK